MKRASGMPLRHRGATPDTVLRPGDFVASRLPLQDIATLCFDVASRRNLSKEITRSARHPKHQSITPPARFRAILPFSLLAVFFAATVTAALTVASAAAAVDSAKPAIQLCGWREDGAQGSRRCTRPMAAGAWLTWRTIDDGPVQRPCSRRDGSVHLAATADEPESAFWR